MIVEMVSRAIGRALRCALPALMRALGSTMRRLMPPEGGDRT